MVCSAQVYALQAEVHTLHLLALTLVGEQVERQFHVLLDGRAVEQRTALENHTYVATDSLQLTESKSREAGCAVVDVARIHGVQTHKAFQKHGLTRAATADNKVCFALLEGGRDVVQYGTTLEAFENMFGSYHRNSINWVITRSISRITIQLITTALVLARPTSSELPRAL